MAARLAARSRKQYYGQQPSQGSTNSTILIKTNQSGFQQRSSRDMAEALRSYPDTQHPLVSPVSAAGTVHCKAGPRRTTETAIDHTINV